MTSTFGFGIALNSADPLPNAVQLLPHGPQIAGRDGRRWTLTDPARLVDAFNQARFAIPIDINHAEHLRAPKGEESPAAGWIEQLELRDGAVWGRVFWTPTGTRALAAREYRYISPALRFNGAGEIVALVGAGLVNSPNFAMPALNARSAGLAHSLASSGEARPLSLNATGVNSMLITPTILTALFTAFNMKFNEGFDGAVSHVKDVAMEVDSTTGEEAYPFLGQFSPLREWIGDRQVTDMAMYGWSIKNKLFESTVGIKRTIIEDDRYGVYGQAFKQMGVTAKLHPDTLIFPLLNSGFSSPCYDGQNFFDTDHPVTDANGNPTVVSNVQTGSGPSWFLLDTTKGFRPFIWQKRVPYEFQSINRSDDEYVFLRDEYLYGIRARVNAGFGLWQLAFGSNAPLNTDNYSAARATMMAIRGNRGGILGVTPNVLVVPPVLEAPARALLKATSVGTAFLVGGTPQAVPQTNIWYQSADLIVSPFLA